MPIESEEIKRTTGMRTKLRYLLTCFVVLVVIIDCSGQNAFAKKSSWEQHILNDVDLPLVKKSSKERFKVFYNKVMIPRELIKILDEWSADHIAFANPNEDYNSTDCSIETLSSRQLIAVFKNKNSMFILYNHGGIGFHRHIIWCQQTRNRITNLWICNYNKSITNIEGLRYYLANFKRAIKLKDGRWADLNYLCY